MLIMHELFCSKQFHIICFSIGMCGVHVPVEVNTMMPDLGVTCDKINAQIVSCNIILFRVRSWMGRDL